MGVLNTYLCLRSEYLCLRLSAAVTGAAWAGRGRTGGVSLSLGAGAATQ